MARTSDTLAVGDTYEALVLRVTPELNQQFLTALDSPHPRYEQIVHPGLLMNFSSITQSPSFRLDDDVAAVGAKFEARYMNPGRVGKTFTFAWTVSEIYERRSRTYQVCDVLITDDDGLEIVRRKINNTFIGGEYLKKRIKWEKEKGYRRALSISEFPEVGYEIVARRRELTMEKMRYFSGGLPGLGWPARNIHTDRDISVRSGIGKPVASGLMLEAYLAELLINFFGQKWLDSGETRVVAVDLVGENDTVVPKAIIRESRGSEAGMECELWCENQYGNKTMVGSARGQW